MEHQILVDWDAEEKPDGIPFLKTCITAALGAEQVGVPCEVDVLLTDDADIREINREQRGIDAPTDVLSFPMFQFVPGEPPAPGRGELDPATGCLPLGDMAISLERAEEQAQEYGHSVERELGYLAVHSVLHLLGYDHLDEGPQKAQMRAREEAILTGLGLARD